MEWCPNCGTTTVQRGVCSGCSTSYRVGYIVSRTVHRRRVTGMLRVSLPNDVEVKRMTSVLNDANNNLAQCGLRYRRRRTDW